MAENGTLFIVLKLMNWLDYEEIERNEVEQ